MMGKEVVVKVEGAGGQRDHSEIDQAEIGDELLKRDDVQVEQPGQQYAEQDRYQQRQDHRGSRREGPGCDRQNDQPHRREKRKLGQGDRIEHEQQEQAQGGPPLGALDDEAGEGERQQDVRGDPKPVREPGRKFELVAEIVDLGDPDQPNIVERAGSECCGGKHQDAGQQPSKAGLRQNEPLSGRYRHQHGGQEERQSRGECRGIGHDVVVRERR